MNNITRIQDRRPYLRTEAAADLTPATAVNINRRRFMTAPEVAARLGMGDLSPRAALDRLRVLHLQGGMPLPISPRIVAGELKTGAAAIHWRSKFDRGIMLSWIEDGAGAASQQRAPNDPPSRQLATRAALANRAALALPRRRGCAA